MTWTSRSTGCLYELSRALKYPVISRTAWRSISGVSLWAAGSGGGGAAGGDEAAAP